MILIEGEKYACLRCIRGHRSSTCRHTSRPLVEVRRRGRPISDARSTVLPPPPCDPGISTVLVPKNGVMASRQVIEIRGPVRKVTKKSSSCCSSSNSSSSSSSRSGKLDYTTSSFPVVPQPPNEVVVKSTTTDYPPIPNLPSASLQVHSAPPSDGNGEFSMTPTLLLGELTTNNNKLGPALDYQLDLRSSSTCPPSAESWYSKDNNTTTSNSFAWHDDETILSMDIPPFCPSGSWDLPPSDDKCCESSKKSPPSSSQCCGGGGMKSHNDDTTTITNNNNNKTSSCCGKRNKTSSNGSSPPYYKNESPSQEEPGLLSPDEFFKVYFASQCSIPGRSCMCGDGCVCVGCTVHDDGTRLDKDSSSPPPMGML